MHADLLTRRRVLLLTYQRYLEADRAWKAALRDVNTWFPPTRRPGPAMIGNPGSRVRRLYEQRERALLQLDTARLKLETARKRLAERRRTTLAPRILLLTRIGP